MKSFREFFAEKTGVQTYPGTIGEMTHTVLLRLANTFADYADYVRDELTVASGKPQDRSASQISQVRCLKAYCPNYAIERSSYCKDHQEGI